MHFGKLLWHRDTHTQSLALIQNLKVESQVISLALMMIDSRLPFLFPKNKMYLFERLNQGSGNMFHQRDRDGKRSRNYGNGPITNSVNSNLRHLSPMIYLVSSSWICRLTSIYWCRCDGAGCAVCSD